MDVGRLRGRGGSRADHLQSDGQEQDELQRDQRAQHDVIQRGKALLRGHLHARFSPMSSFHRIDILSFSRAGSRFEFSVGLQADLITPDDTWADDVGTLQTSYMRGAGVVLRYSTRYSSSTFAGLSSIEARG